MDKTYMIFFNIVKFIMIILNIIAVMFYSIFICLTTKYITTNGLSRDFLDHLNYAPNNPMTILIYSVILLILLVYLMYYRDVYKVNNEMMNYGYSLLELIVSVGLILNTYIGYSGIILLIFCDCIYHLKRNIFNKIFLIILICIFLFFNSEIIVYLYPLPNIEAYFSVYNYDTKNLLLTVRSLINSLNIILFIICLIIYILKQIYENEYILRKLSMISTINKKLEKYVVVTEKFAQRNERKRLARELHDTIGHALAGMAVGVDACITIIDKNPQLAKAQLKIISKEIRSGMKEVRDSLNKMRPNFLQQYRLKEALENLIGNFSKIANVDINFIYDINGLNIDNEIEDTIYRIVQESITNSIRHGLASKIDIKILKKDDMLNILIKDNGNGCKDIKLGFGLKQMRERISLLQGKMNLASNDGFYIEIYIPIKYQ